MSTTRTEENWAEEIGNNAFAAIAEMVAALQADYDRLEELRDERGGWDSDEHDARTWEEVNPEDAEELAELEEAAGDCKDQDDARQRIEEDPLSMKIFCCRVNGGEWELDSYELLLATGGPAVRIIGDLNDFGEPTRAVLQVQDWGRPWTDVFHDGDTLMAYASCFHFGE